MKKSSPKFLSSLFFLAIACSHTGSNTSGTQTSRAEIKTDGAERIVVLYLADVHGRLRTDVDGLGGYARIRSWVDREKAAAGSKTDVVVVGGGDLTDKGSLPCLLKGDLPCMPLLADLGIDFSAIGNHEIQRPVSDTRSLLALSRIRWISANVSPVSGPKLWDPYVDYVGNKSGIRVRFLSFTKELDPVAHANRYKDFRFRPGPRTEAEWKPFIPQSTPYILVNHQPTDTDLQMLDGLCKSQLKKPLLLLKADEEQMKWRNPVHCVEGLEPGPHGKVVGRIVMEKDPVAGAKVTEATFVDMNDLVSENSELRSSVNALYLKHAPEADVKLGLAERAHSLEEMAQWLSDSYKTVTRADVAIVNGGAAKSGLTPGEVTRERIRLVFPYNNQLMGLDWSFDAMAKALCRATARQKKGDQDFGSELFISGAKLINPGTPDCKLVANRRGKLKVVVDDYVYRKSASWLGEDLSRQNTWRFGVETPLAIEERLKRDPKSL